MMLHDSEQLPMRCVAQRLGLSVPAAKSRLVRARKELRSRIQKHCGIKGSGTLLQTAEYSRTAYAWVTGCCGIGIPDHLLISLWCKWPPRVRAQINFSFKNEREKC